MTFNWKIKATNAIYLEDSNGQQGRPFKSRFLQAGLVKYDFGVCLLQKETIDRFINTFMGVPVIIDHKDNITESDKVGSIDKIWFSPEDGWFWCSGVITDDTAVKLIEQGYNVSCQYSITEYADNIDDKLHNGNPYDKEILNGVFEHLAIVENPRYEGAYIAVNAYIASNAIARNNIVDKNGDEHSEKNGQYVPKGRESGALSIEEKLKQIKPIKIDKSKIPPTQTKRDISDWVKNIFEELQEVTIKDTNTLIKLSKESAERETIKRRVKKEENKAVYSEFDGLVSDAIKVKDRPQDERHNRDQEIYYNEFDFDGDIYSLDLFIDKPSKDDKEYRYAGHKAYKKTPRDTTGAVPNRNAKGANNIITDSKTDFNPNATNSIDIDYKKVFDYLTNSKGEQMDNKKDIISAIIDALKARNEAEEEKDKKDEKDAKNEKVDKRDLIRQIMAIAGKREDDEDVRTIAKLAEKLAYDDSDAGTADNAKNSEKEPKKDEKKEDEAKNKGKNEGEEPNYEELYKKLKSEVEEEAENKKGKNSMDELVNQIHKAFEPDITPAYISTKHGIELGKKIYG